MNKIVHDILEPLIAFGVAAGVDTSTRQKERTAQAGPFSIYTLHPH